MEPLKYFVSTAPDDATLKQIVFVTKMRWRIERDYQELRPKNSDSDNMRGAVGASFTITLRFASPLPVF